jgi:hypothetical protein
MVGIRSVDNKPIDGRPNSGRPNEGQKGKSAKSGPAKTQPPFQHPGKMMEKPGGKRASGADKSKEPKRGGSGSMGSTGDRE